MMVEKICRYTGLPWEAKSEYVAAHPAVAEFLAEAARGASIPIRGYEAASATLAEAARGASTVEEAVELARESWASRR